MEHLVALQWELQQHLPAEDKALRLCLHCHRVPRVCDLPPCPGEMSSSPCMGVANVAHTVTLLPWECEGGILVRRVGFGEGYRKLTNMEVLSQACLSCCGR